MFKRHTICRACGSEDLKPAFEFDQPQPLANDFHAIDMPLIGRAPLAVLFCEQCSLAQLSVVVDPQLLYQTYAYITSKSETMRLHFRSLWGAITEQGKAESVIEIGSNTGDFLQFARANGADLVAGVDPAENLAAIAIRNGIQTIIGTFHDYTAINVSQIVPQADVIVARHVFAHVDNWREFVRNLDTIANRDTLVVIEVPWVIDTLTRVEWDQCLLPGQQVICGDGLRNIEHVRLGDMVMTHTGNFRRVTHVFSRTLEHFNQVDISVYGQSSPVCLTDEHPLFVSRRKGAPRWIKAGDVILGDKVLKPAIKTITSEPITLTVVYGSKQRRITEFQVNLDLVRIAGYYAAEGAYTCTGRNSSAAYFTFGKKESERRLAMDCAEALKRHGAKGGIKLTQYGWKVSTYGAMAKMLHEQFGTGAKNKRLPEWMFTMPLDLTEEFVRAYVNGDGYVYRNGRYLRAGTVSPTLAHGVSLLANKLGWCCSVNKQKALTPRFIHKNKRISEHMLPCFDILIRIVEQKKIKCWFKDGYQWATVKKISSNQGNGTVHNLEVEIDNSYVTPQGAVHNCYHEHLSYVSIKAMAALLDGTSFHIQKVKHFAVHGGSNAVFLRRNDSGITPDASVKQFLDAENITLETWKDFSNAAKAKIAALKDRVAGLRRNGRVVAGYGASAKSTVWLAACGFTQRDIAFLVDNTPQKQGKYSPVGQIPILPESALARAGVAIVFAWPYFDEIVAKNKAWSEAGGEFLNPHEL